MKPHHAKLKEKQVCSKPHRFLRNKEDHLISDYKKQLESLNNRFQWPPWIQTT